MSPPPPRPVDPSLHRWDSPGDKIHLEHRVDTLGKALEESKDKYSSLRESFNMLRMNADSLARQRDSLQEENERMREVIDRQQESVSPEALSSVVRVQVQKVAKEHLVEARQCKEDLFRELESIQSEQRQARDKRTQHDFVVEKLVSELVSVKDGISAAQESQQEADSALSSRLEALEKAVSDSVATRVPHPEGTVSVDAQALANFVRKFRDVL